MRPKYQTAKAVIPNGDNESQSVKFALNPSEINHLVTATKSHDEDISVAIDHNGNEIIPFIPITFLDGKEGSLDERALELDFTEQRNLELRAKSNGNVSQDTTVTFVFKRYEN